MRLIDAEKLIKHLETIDNDREERNEGRETSFSYGESCAMQKVYEAIGDQYVFDANPNIHAHWIDDEAETGEYSNTYKCSRCGAIYQLIDGNPRNNGYGYCPKCGAKMDEVLR